MRIRRQEGYLLQKIGKTVYLLPYGQKIADQKRGMELNETALRLWEMLEQPQTVEALTDRMAAYYEIPKEEQGEPGEGYRGICTGTACIWRCAPGTGLSEGKL